MKTLLSKILEELFLFTSGRLLLNLQTILIVSTPPACLTYMWGHGMGGVVASSELHVGNTRSQQCIDHLKTNNCNPKKF